MPRTHIIKIEQGEIVEPTEVSKVDNSTSPENSVSNKEKKSVNTTEQDLIKTGGMIAMANQVSKVAQRWQSIKGQNAKANQLKVASKYGTAIAISMATAPILTPLVVGYTYTKDRNEYALEITESNATTIYLQEQSRSTVDSSRGDYYRYKF